MRRELLQKVFTHLPVLRTERLLLRRICPKDAADMFSYSCMEEVTRYLLWDPHPSLDYTRQFIDYLDERYDAGDFYDWAVTLKDGGKMIGTCGFTRLDTEQDTGEIGYVLHPDFWGKGYATEAARAVLSFGFDRLGLHRITAECMTENVASTAVMEKCGMQREGLLRDAVKRHDAYFSVVQYAAVKNGSEF